MVGIYKITSPTGKIYIGQSSDVERRISAYKRMSNCNQQPKLYNSLKKHGARNHLYEAIEECDINNCTERERYYQELYNSVKEGLNCVYVDNSNSKTSICDETRQKMSKSRKGVKFTNQHKERISKALKGKVRSIEHRLNLSKSNKGRMTGEHHHNSILLLNTETGIYYETVKEASESYKAIAYSTLKSKLNGSNSLGNNTPFILA